MTPATLDRLAREMRQVNPRRLAAWEGWKVGGALINPYLDYASSYHLKQPRAVQIADLLVGDLVVDVLLHPELKVDSKDGCTFWPHRGRRDD